MSDHETEGAGLRMPSYFPFGSLIVNMRDGVTVQVQLVHSVSDPVRWTLVGGDGVDAATPRAPTDLGPMVRLTFSPPPRAGEEGKDTNGETDGAPPRPTTGPTP